MRPSPWEPACILQSLIRASGRRPGDLLGTEAHLARTPLLAVHPPATPRAIWRAPGRISAWNPTGDTILPLEFPLLFRSWGKLTCYGAAHYPIDGWQGCVRAHRRPSQTPSTRFKQNTGYRLRLPQGQRLTARSFHCSVA